MDTTKILDKIKNVKLYYVAGVVVLLLFIYVGIETYLSKSDLRDKGIKVNVKIIEAIFPTHGGGNGSYGFRCVFVYNGEQKKLISASRIKIRASSYIGQTFPALYSKKYDELRLLMTQEDFEEFNLEFPDSMVHRVNQVVN